MSTNKVHIMSAKCEVFHFNKSLQNVHIFSVKRAGIKNCIKRAIIKNNNNENSIKT